MDKVLVVNDSKFERKVFKYVLKQLDKEVSESKEFEVFEKIDEIKPNVVIINLIMKDIRGDDLIQRLKKRYPKIKYILSSCSQINFRDYRDKKVDAVLQTPVEEKELAEIFEFLERQQEIGEEKIETKKDNEFSFCSYCGKDFTEEVVGEILFCPYCGQKI
ncbi:response regulator [Natroniella sulfidigena]|uniref:response regulator n=1 Tax=Natroniella sulfidigena TaxID=723921 RepID=UPI00200B92B6|nr:response regulator [Natroniella sulfidigena]